MFDLVYETGVEIILIIQSFGHWLYLPMYIFSLIGTVPFYLVIIPALYWCVDSRIGLRLSMLLMISAGINSIFKVMLHQPRPYWIDQNINSPHPETSFGAPSGHAQNSVVFWGSIGYWLKSRWIWLLSILMILSISFSRMYLGVHYLQDILLGWIIGIILLIVFNILEQPIIKWSKKTNPIYLVIIAFIFSSAFIIVMVMVIDKIESWQMPQSWMITEGEALYKFFPAELIQIESIVTISGVLFGVIVGAILIQKNGGFKITGTIWQKILRYVFGLLVAGIIYLASSIFAPDENSSWILFYQYFVFSIIGLWIIGIAPRVFVKLKLAEPA